MRKGETPGRSRFEIVSKLPGAPYVVNVDRGGPAGTHKSKSERGFLLALYRLSNHVSWRSPPGRNTPAANRVLDAPQQMRKPAVKLPRRSRRTPTIIGEMNIAAPEKVSREPHMTATFLGSPFATAIVVDNRVGTYSQEPIPTTNRDA